MAPWWWFLCDPKHVGVTVGILIVLIFLWFCNCVHHCGTIKSALLLLMHGTNMKIMFCNCLANRNGYEKATTCVDLLKIKQTKYFQQIPFCKQREISMISLSRNFPTSALFYPQLSIPYPLGAVGHFNKKSLCHVVSAFWRRKLVQREANEISSLHLRTFVSRLFSAQWKLFEILDK
jgi:hypothetical protein